MWFGFCDKMLSEYQKKNLSLYEWLLNERKKISKLENILKNVLGHFFSRDSINGLNVPIELSLEIKKYHNHYMHRSTNDIPEVCKIERPFIFGILFTVLMYEV